MDKEILKSTLFGYSKISVCQYIATMNEEFNAKLMAEEASFREERTNLQKKIDELEAELTVHKQNACDVGRRLDSMPSTSASRRRRKRQRFSDRPKRKLNSSEPRQKIKRINFFWKLKKKVRHRPKDSRYTPRLLLRFGKI